MSCVVQYGIPDVVCPFIIVEHKLVRHRFYSRDVNRRARIRPDVYMATFARSSHLEINKR